MLACLAKAFDKHATAYLSLIFFIGVLASYSTFIPIYNIGDGFSIYIAATRLIQEGNLNFWGVYNEAYASPFFSYTYHDIVIKGMGEIYPIQFVGTILIYAGALQFGGTTLFYLVSPTAGALTIAGLYLLSVEVFNSRVKALLPPLILFLAPIFVIWSVFPGNAAISTMFFIYSILFSLRVHKGPTVVNKMALSISLAFLVLTRYPHALLAAAVLGVLALIAFMDKPGIGTKITKRDILAILVLSLAIMLFTLLVLNYIWFGDPLFIAYFFKNNVPSLGADIPSGVDSYFLGLLKTDRILNTLQCFVSYFIVSNAFLPFFALSWLSILFVAKRFRKRTAKDNQMERIIVLLFLIPWLCLITYYGAASSSPWSASPTAPCSRYMLPTYALLPVFSVFLLESCLRMVREPLKSGFRWRTVGVSISRSNAMTLTIVIIVLISGFNSYSFTQLIWIDNMDSCMDFYQDAAESIPKGSIILYGSRWPLLSVLPIVDDFVWFYYIGIPEAYRKNETIRTVEMLFSNNESVLIFSCKYDSPQETVMLDTLSFKFHFTRLNDTYFRRLEGIFYLISTNPP